MPPNPPEPYIRSFCRAAEGSIHRRMARVLEWSARQHGHSIEVTYGDTVESPFVDKAVDWAATVKKSRADRLTLLDCDTLIRADLSSVWLLPFDVAVTRHRERLNSGVLFVRPSPPVSAFFAGWAALTRTWIARNPPGEKPRYSDQDALDQMLAANVSLTIATLDMAEWNSTQLTWHLGVDHARILHVKSGARHFLSGENRRPTRYEIRVASTWLAAEREMLRNEQLPDQVD